MNERLTPEQEREIRDRVEQATKGPLEIEQVDTGRYGNGYLLEGGVFDAIGDEDCGRDVIARKEDAEFFAHAEPDVRALLAEIDALRQERDDLGAGVLVSSLALRDFEERLDRITAVAEETAEKARNIMAAAHANYESADSWRHRCQGVEEDLKMSQSNYKTLLDNEVRLRRKIKDMQADTARAVELLEPLTRKEEPLSPLVLRVCVEQALRYWRPLEDER